MPVDPKTGKKYPYTKEGIEKYKKETGGMPMKKSGFKMKSGSPFQRNFDISPMKTEAPHKPGTMNPNFKDLDMARGVFTDSRLRKSLTEQGYDWDTLGSDPEYPNRIFLGKPKEKYVQSNVYATNEGFD